MRQILQNLHSGETIVAEVPVPTPQPGEALVRTAASLVSAGTERMLVEFAGKSLVGKARSRPDLVRQVMDKARREGVLTTIEAAFNRLDQPLPLGYSSSGVVTALGPGLEGIRLGQRVACAGGGYAVHAEYACVPQNLMAPLPDKVDFESAAFATLGAIALHGFRLAEVQLGERVAVIGLGLLGLLASKIARAAGCRVLGVELDAARVALADQMGVPAVLRENAEEAASSFSRGQGCDAVIICADSPSADPVELAGVIARDRARVIAIGAVDLQVPRKLYYEKELTLINSRSYGPGRYDPNYEEAGQDYPIGYVRWTEGRNLEAFIELLAEGRLEVKPLITHRFPIDQAPQAYELITGKRKEPFLGVLLTYPSGAEEPVSRVVIQASQAIPRSPRAGKQAVRLGVLGAGNFASGVMLPVLGKIPNLELVGVTSASGMSAQSAASRFGFRYAASDDAQIIHDPQVDAVAILTRHNLHAPQVVASLAAGKHVFCEKPLALNEQELEEIVEAMGRPSNRAGEQPGILAVGFNRRFAPLAIRLKEFLEGRNEPLAAHYRINAGTLPPGHWLHDPEVGGGRIIGEGCHFVDFLTFLVGEAPLEVTARALPDVGRYHEDNAVLTFTFGDGSVGVISYLANGDKTLPKERLEVYCAGKVGILDDFRSLELVHGGKRQGFRSPLRQDKGHRAEWEAFVRAIQSGGPPPIPYLHLFGVTRACFASIQALRSSLPVKIA